MNVLVRSFEPSAGGAKARRAFTLIETMVAIAILTLSIAGPLYTADRAIVAAQTANAQLTATYLAQEGIEYVRMMRDNEYLLAYGQHGSSISATAWTYFLTDPISDTSAITPCIAPKVCTLDLVQGAPSPLASFASANDPGIHKLYLTNCTNGANGLSCTPPNFYTQQNIPGSVQTAFTRTVQAVAVSATDERITSTVSWVFHGTPYAVTVTDHLTPWQ